MWCQIPEDNEGSLVHLEDYVTIFVAAFPLAARSENAIRKAQTWR